MLALNSRSNASANPANYPSSTGLQRDLHYSFIQASLSIVVVRANTRDFASNSNS